MDTTLIGALAALSGSALGGVAPIFSSYLIQKGMTTRELLTRELGERQKLYAHFIQFGTKLYVNTTTTAPNDETVDGLVELYALVSRIRLYASQPVIEAAEDFAALVTKLYGATALSIDELRARALTDHVDPLNLFSNCCRRELATVRK